MNTAILVDGGFYRKRAQKLFGELTPEERANELNTYCWRHLSEKNIKHDLYRIFYYDCEPMKKKLFHPFTKQQIDFSQTELYIWMNTFLNELKKKRKFALRMGTLSEEQANYTIRANVVKKLCNGTRKFQDLTESDFQLNLDQKGVDMKIGIDIASMAFKRQVDKLVLISGDSDFVPAAKLARREGIDFVLDPMGAKIKEELFEHIDGLRSCDNRIHNN
ncbi:MAG: NYN domain-containing protein [Lachnospiraceae bacterium]|nr:NYN domain-containing protein [Lachnospiraceae bacterium]